MGQVLLVRHGQASFGADDYDVLSETGWEQSRALGRWLAERGVVADAVLHGEMRRQRETAEAMAQAAGWTVATAVDAGWNEFDHRAVVAAFGGVPDTVDRAGFQAAFTAALGRWIAGEPGEVPESFPDFAKRAAAALTRACAGAGPGGTVVVSSSGGPIAAACAALLEPDRPTVERGALWARLNTVILNASCSRVVIGSTGPRLLTFNEHDHVPEAQRTYR